MNVRSRWDAGSTDNGRADKPASPKLAEQLAYRIEQRIINMNWPTGQLLGSEPDLLEEYSVSRAVFREAVRILEHHGTAHMKRGAGGGLVITDPTLGPVRRSASLFLRNRHVAAPDLLTARTALEVSCVRQLALGISAEDEERMRTFLANEVENTESAGFTTSLRTFHLELVSLLRNEPLRLFTEILLDLQADFAPRRVGRESTNDTTIPLPDVESSHAAHEAIFQAVLKGDPDAAARRMERHLQALSTYRPGRRSLG